MVASETPNTNTSVSPAEISKEIKTLIMALPEIHADAARLDQLRRLFTRLEAEGELAFGTPPRKSAVAAKWRKFLRKSHETMVSQLCERIQLGRHASVRCLFGVIAGSPVTHAPAEKRSAASYKSINIDLLRQWIEAMTKQEKFPMDKGMKQMLVAEFFGPYRDVQYHSLGCISALATAAAHGEGVGSNDESEGIDTNDIEKANLANLAQRLLEILMMIPVPASDQELEENSQYLFPPPGNASPDLEQEQESSSEDNEDSLGEESSDEEQDENSMDRNSESRPSKRQKIADHGFPFQRLRMIRREYQKAWLAVLRLRLPATSLKHSLLFLSENTAKFPHPLRFADFFMQAYSDHENSAMIGIQALDGLFLLITEYGLEYPNFYKQLYKLLSTKVLFSKFRARFFSLLTKCLVRNEMLPAHLVAAFVKRLCRCSLSGPPSGALFVLALVSNLLRKHPECGCLIQRKDKSPLEDSFLPDEDDPEECCALQSSLWELAVFEKHYYPAVATLAKSIGRQEEDKTPMHVMEEFAGHTYASLISQEKKKKSKTALAFEKPESLFKDGDIFAGCMEMGV